MTDCLIVGGGIIGMLTSRYLSQAGAKITLLERGAVGKESSWAGGGILSPLYPWRYAAPINRLAYWSQQHYSALADELLTDTGVDPEWTQSGLLILDRDEYAPASHWAHEFSASLQTLDSNTLSHLEPAVGTRPSGALYLPEVAQVRNPNMLRALRLDLEARGVRIVENTEVSQLLTHEGGIAGVGTHAGEMLANKVIITCGAWSSTLLKGLGESVQIAPVRGQMLLYRADPDLLHHIILYGGHYAIPRRDGHILVGSTMEEVGFDKTVTAEARRDLKSVAHALIPALAKASLEHHWAGLRPGSPAGVPYIGEHPRLAGLYLNAGHHRNGVVMGPASARLLADLILDRTPEVDPRPYSLDKHFIAT